MSHNNYSLFFSAHYDRDPWLDQYILALTHPDKGQLYEWQATSSHVNGQQRGDQHTWGGLIPPAHHCVNLDKWEVDLNPVDLSHNVGVRGNFYRILPFTVVTNKGGKRGDLGIHLDANKPGSLGCIVMNRFNWNEFDNVMNQLRTQQDVTRIPLFPLYS